MGHSSGVIGCRCWSGTGVWVRDVHTEMVSAEFMCGNFVVYRLNINILQFRERLKPQNTKELVAK